MGLSGRVDRVDAFPLSYSLDTAYGSARGTVAARTTTLVRLVTTDGVAGWGECFGPPRVMAPLVEELSAPLIGQPVSDIEPFIAQSLQRAYHLSNGGLHVCALSGLDIAMWDAWARTLDVSVSRLLGGRARDVVRAYASTGYVTADLEVERFKESVLAAVEEGFTAVKVKIGLGLELDRPRAEATREAIGDAGILMVDFNANCTADTARRIVDGLSDLNIYWMEEPVPPEDLEGYRSLRQLGIPVAAGEALFTRYGFREIIASRLVDVVQPDVQKCGGLSEAKVIAHLARTWNVRLAPHHWGGAVSQAATLQFLASIPDYPHTEHAPEPLWLEFDRAPNALREDLPVEPIRADGSYVEIPDGPGLGIELNDDAVQALRLERVG
jgi:D-galactarolactone cycloisomerase